MNKVQAIFRIILNIVIFVQLDLKQERSKEIKYLHILRDILNCFDPIVNSV